jgi:hypothetical protein
MANGVPMPVFSQEEGLETWQLGQMVGLCCYGTDQGEGLDPAIVWNVHLCCREGQCVSQGPAQHMIYGKL